MHFIECFKIVSSTEVFNLDQKNSPDTSTPPQADHVSILSVSCIHFLEPCDKKLNTHFHILLDGVPGQVGHFLVGLGQKVQDPF